MQVTDKLRSQMGTWIDVFAEYIQSSEMDKVFSFLKAESSKGKIICPRSPDLFKSFELCNRHKMKAVIMLQDPYPTFKGDIMTADGIPMSCKYTKMLQPSLQLWYAGIETEYKGFDPDMDMRPDISYLLEEEHIMLINCGLSCEKDKSGSHNTNWQSFMQHFCKVLNESYRGLPVVMCGTSAQKYEKDISPLIHHIKKIEHPVAAAYQNREWRTEGLFKWIDWIIEQNNGKEEVPRWYRKVGEGKKALPAPWDEPDTSTVPHLRSIDKKYNDAFKDLPFD